MEKKHYNNCYNDEFNSIDEYFSNEYEMEEDYSEEYEVEESYYDKAEKCKKAPKKCREVEKCCICRGPRGP